MHSFRIAHPLVLGALLIAPSLTLAAPSFTVFAGPGNSSGCPGATEVIGDSPVPVSASHVCSFFRGSAAADAVSTFGSVGADTNAIKLGGDSVFIADGAAASFSDTLTFSKLDPDLPDQFTVSLNLSFEGVVNAGAPEAGFAQATALVTVGFLSLRQLELTYHSTGFFLVRNAGGFAGTGTIAPGAAGFDSLLTTPGAVASIGDVPFSIQLNTGVAAVGNGASATSDFSNTLELPTGMDVFDLPAGYTVNAGSYLVNNRFIDLSVAPAIPEPQTYALMLVGLGVSSVVLRRRKGRAER